VQPFGTAIEREPGRFDGVDPPADTVARLEHQERDHTGFAQTPRRADPGGTSADHRDIDLGWQARHLLPRCRPKGGLP